MRPIPTVTLPLEGREPNGDGTNIAALIQLFPCRGGSLTAIKITMPTPILLRDG